MPYPAEEFINSNHQGATSDPDLMLAKNSQGRQADKTVWLSVSEVAKLGGLSTKTVRRGIESGQLRYRVINNRYQISLEMAIKFYLSSPTLSNKFNQDGLGKWVEKWKIN